MSIVIQYWPGCICEYSIRSFIFTFTDVKFEESSSTSSIFLFQLPYNVLIEIGLY